MQTSLGQMRRQSPSTSVNARGQVGGSEYHTSSSSIECLLFLCWLTCGLPLSLIPSQHCTGFLWLSHCSCFHVCRKLSSAPRATMVAGIRPPRRICSGASLVLGCGVMGCPPTKTTASCNRDVSPVSHKHSYQPAVLMLVIQRVKGR